jgi:hypothetical protein
LVDASGERGDDDEDADDDTDDDTDDDKGARAKGATRTPAAPVRRGNRDT